MNILYISSCRNLDKPYQNSSFRYRCFNPAQALSAAGVLVDVATMDRVSLHIIDRYDLIIFHRPVMGKKLERLVNRAKQRRCAIVADYDDLIFNPAYAHQSPGVLNQQHLLSAVIATFKRRYDALCLFDNFSVSTTPLAAEIRKIRPGSEINVLPNGLSDVWLKHARRLCSRKFEVRRITYLPGTSSHHHDFAAVEDIFSGFLSDNPDAVLRIVGPLNFKKEKFNVRQLELVRYVPYPFLPELIYDSWVTIAPLVSTLFNNCKSGLKYFESAAFGVPVIASPIDDMLRLSSKALHLADTPEQWLKALHLLSDKTYYEQCSLSGINHVNKHCAMSPHLYEKAFAQYV